MTFSEIQTEVFRIVEEVSGDPEYFALSEVKDAINEGWQDLALRTLWYKDVITVPLQDEVTYYDLRDFPSDVLKVDRVWDRTTSRWLDPTTVQLLEDGAYFRWEAVTSDPPKNWFLRGLFWLGVFPKTPTPTLPTNSTMIDVHVRAVPPPLGPDDYSPPFAEDYHYALVDYAAYELFSQDGETELALSHFESYMTKEEDMAKYVRNITGKGIVRHHGGSL